MVPAAKPTTMARPFQAIHFKESVLSHGCNFFNFSSIGDAIKKLHTIDQTNRVINNINTSLIG